MLTILIAAAIVCQDQEWTPKTEPLPDELPRIDLEFALAVEDSIGRRAITPEPYRTLIKLQGGRCWRCRQVFTGKLERLVRDDPGASRWLMRGRWDGDLEIAVRCNTILRNLNTCTLCKGTGVLSKYYDQVCWACKGHGTMWHFWIDD
jgi:hypothetical protein